MTEKTEQPESFETLLKKLEEIVRKMEDGGLPLEESMTLYEEGIGMADKLSAMLAGNREKVMKLVGDREGGPVLEVFEEDGEAE